MVVAYGVLWSEMEPVARPPSSRQPSLSGVDRFSGRLWAWWRIVRSLFAERVLAEVYRAAADDLRRADEE